ncbi:MAG: DUF6438 domain-containing protein [Bacteroidia bacterium]|nr:DUF6438 domain-containing protein [Bacteroidia bacterium]MDW8133665.1 DUF6438 domain-containing protein [Bacteroidia bacterium]
MKSIVLLLSALMSSIAQQCTFGSKQRKSTQGNLPKDLYIQIQRTACYGRCPVDKVELLSDGTVKYEGIRFVSRLGIYTRKLSQEEQKQVEKLLKELAFERYEEVYDNPGISDLPSLILVYRLEGKEKKITCRVGCPPELPDKIEQLRAFLADQGNFKMEKGPAEESSHD